ncbi:MAG: cupredoxin domain-containing protein [Chloroflexota bacterium]|nr:cupredoxin domain-containing protein [Chloroflexota bacterium]
MNPRSLLARAGAGLALCALLGSAGSATLGQSNSRLFPETGHTVAGQFLTYWDGHGGLTQQGYPIAEEMQEKSDLNGQSYTVQYFERAVFEKHPENKPPFDTLLSQLGTFRYQTKYPTGAPDQHVSTVNARKFAETGHTVGGVFRSYWESHGGLAQQGYPISDEFTEKSDLNGQPYTVQYFERAVFELHPENKPPFDVLLSQLGTFQYRIKYQLAGSPVATGTARPATAVPATAVPPTAVPPTLVPATATAPSGVTQTYSVKIVNYTFSPARLTVPVGSKVVWINQDNDVHTVTSDSGLFESGTMPKGRNFSRTFTAVGSYGYSCTFHPGMDGTIEVVAAP